VLFDLDTLFLLLIYLITVIVVCHLWGRMRRFKEYQEWRRVDAAQHIKDTVCEHNWLSPRLGIGGIMGDARDFTRRFCTRCGQKQKLQITFVDVDDWTIEEERE
jgi:hypothetical protein